nr:MAG TPA: periplasmic binding protein [Caudoviricetes sp.]
MNGTSTMKRHYRNYILASMLTAALSLSSCASRKASSVTVRSDSLRVSVTEQTTYEPVPKRTATLSVSARQMKDLVNLSQGIGISARNNGLSIDIQSDGEGGVNVTATADSLDRKVTTRSEMSDHRIRDETGESKNITQPGWKGVLWKLIISTVVILGISTVIVIKHKLKR